MACFLAPAGAAVVTTVAQKVLRKKKTTAHAQGRDATAEMTAKWSQRLRWLNIMLWTGSALLCLEHIWRGEVVFRPPFFTALGVSGGGTAMLREIATEGTAITVGIVVLWAIIIGVVALLQRRVETPGVSETQDSSVIDRV